MCKGVLECVRVCVRVCVLSLTVLRCKRITGVAEIV